ncbi:multicopper oxidase family protein [Actinoplanes couchii]|uniref:Plastocyanin-like domain-containing protein n=1 Tax=Actinoplanes couchii TaxID=403638 RepID=A0ABQ3XH00_9ACTN|nr:multicopper oxidase domain-containing protein [Actinoplanes couchii]MDR6320764.1 FtsP/CotA-like multicopper oxidase with cupredoxin domain [Actinoplanes couchii]GID57751.1 hypothetical protein Aco03nite_061550 [Actinoplanes couchii]
MDGISRRRLLRWGAAVVAPLATGGAVGLRLAADLRHRSPAVPKFRVALPIPPVLRPTIEDGVDRYEIRQAEADVEIIPGRPTRILGYDGIFPGPTIEARRNRPVAVRHVNELDVPTVVHLHGGVLPPEEDGYPTDLVLPRGVHQQGHHAAGPGGIAHGERVYRYPNEQSAALLWYHDHRMDFTGRKFIGGWPGSI